MELTLDRNEQCVYELRLGEVVLAHAPALSDLVGKAQTYAKKFQKKLFVSQAAISDWYIGFPLNKDESPEIFFDPYYMLKAQLEGETSPYRFVEGPFLSDEAAQEAAFKISGKVARSREQ